MGKSRAEKIVEVKASIRKHYGATMTALVKKLDEQETREKFLSTLCNIQNHAVTSAAEAAFDNTPGGKLASQLFFTLSSLLPAMFIKAVGQTPDGAAFSSVRSAFMSNMSEAMILALDAFVSDDPRGTFAKSGMAEVIELP